MTPETEQMLEKCAKALDEEHSDSFGTLGVTVIKQILTTHLKELLEDVDCLNAIWSAIDAFEQKQRGVAQAHMAAQLTSEIRVTILTNMSRQRTISRLEILAIKCLPPENVLDGSTISQCGERIVYEHPTTHALIFENYMWRSTTGEEIQKLFMGKK